MPATPSSALEGGAPRLLTLTTDFGLQDPYVGIMKSRIALRAPQLRVIDLTHAITPYYPEEAGYWLSCARGQFPAGTVHVAVVDPGVGSERALALLGSAGQWFLAPDNGLLGLLAAADPDAMSYRLEADALAALGIAAHSSTFHGRDILAPLGAELASGRVRPEQLGTPHPVLPGCLAWARPEGEALRGQIAVIDRYGNALTTISAQQVSQCTNPAVQLAGQTLRLVRTYAEAAKGECVALVNSQSMLELAQRQGSAAQALKLRPTQPVYLLYAHPPLDRVEREPK